MLRLLCLGLWAIGHDTPASQPTRARPPSSALRPRCHSLTHTTTFSSTSSYYSPPNTTTTAIMSDFNAIARKLQRAHDCSRLMLTSSIQSSSPSTTTRPSTRTAPNLRRSTCVTKNIQETCLQADELTYPCSARTPCSPLSSRLSSVLPTSSPSSRYASISRSRKAGVIRHSTGSTRVADTKCDYRSFPSSASSTRLLPSTRSPATRVVVSSSLSAAHFWYDSSTAAIRGEHNN